MGSSSPLRPRADGRLSRRQLDNVAQLAQAGATAGMSKMQILRSLPPKRRIPYFLEQYGWPLGLGLITAAIAVFLAVRILFPPVGPQLYVAVMDQALDATQTETLQKRFSERSGIPEDEILVDSYFDTRKDGLSKLQTLLSSDDIDVILAPEDTFATLAGYGYLVPLDDTRTADANTLVSLPGYDDAHEDDPDYSGSGKGETLPSGIRLGTGDKVWRDIQGPDDMIVGLAQDSEHAAQAGDFLAFLTGDAGLAAQAHDVAESADVTAAAPKTD